MEEMPRKSAAELEAECLRLLAMDPHTRGIKRVEIIRMYPKGTGPNWTYGALDPMPTRAGVAIAQTLIASAYGRWALHPSLVGGRINHHMLVSPRLRTILMVVAGGDYVHFVVEYGGKIEKCRVTETALLNRERMSRKDVGYAQLIAIFVRHRAEIEHLALAKLQREGHSDRGVVVTTDDLNP
jgi:hypothetical protein